MPRAVGPREWKTWCRPHARQPFVLSRRRSRHGDPISKERSRLPPARFCCRFSFRSVEAPKATGLRDADTPSLDTPATGGMMAPQ